MPRVSTCERTLDRRLEQRWSYANALLRSICGKEIGVTERGDNILVVSKTDALWGLPKLMQEERVDNTSSAEPIGLDLRRQQTATVVPIAVAFPVAIVLWFGTYYLLPPLAGMEDVVARLVFALKCSCVAILFCFVAGIEAVAHERLRSPAIDPLSGYDTPRMRVNLRYLQNTLEQLAPFVAGVFLVSRSIVPTVARCARLLRRPSSGSRRALPSGLGTIAVRHNAALVHPAWW
jgi:hypothetical protein